MTCQNGQAFHWRWGGELAELPSCTNLFKDITIASDLKKLTRRGLGAVFHPHEHICYLVHLYAAGPAEETSDDVARSSPRVYIVKYTRDQCGAWTPALPVKQWALNRGEHSDYSYQILDRRFNATQGFDTPGRVELACKKADNHGSFLVAVHCSESPHESTSYLAKAVCFNVFTERYFTVPWCDEVGFATPHVHGSNPKLAGLPSEDIRRLCVWNRSVYKRNPVPYGVCLGDFPCLTETEVWLSDTTGLHWAPPGPWSRTTFHGTRSEYSSLEMRVDLYVDDEFVVLCHGEGYRVHLKSSCNR